MPHTHRLFAAILVAISGAAVMVAIAIPGRPDPELVLAAAGGAFVAGAVGAPLFGQPARRGGWLAVLGAVFTTVLGAAVAGLGIGLFEIGPGIVFLAPMVVVAGIATMPHVLLTWVVTMAGAHLVMRAVRSTPGAKV